MTHRTIEREGSFILPYLQQLPAAFTFFDVGCGPGSIPLSVALKFPSATVLGIDIDAKTIEVSNGVYSRHELCCLTSKL